MSAFNFVFAWACLLFLHMDQVSGRDPCSITPDPWPECPISKTSGNRNGSQAVCVCPDGFVGKPTKSGIGCMPLDCTVGGCGYNAFCDLKSERCQCRMGYEGDPYLNCVKTCFPNPCGKNAECKSDRSGTQCTCINDYDGDPYKECRRTGCLDDCDCGFGLGKSPLRSPYCGNDGWCHTDTRFGNKTASCEAEDRMYFEIRTPFEHICSSENECRNMAGCLQLCNCGQCTSICAPPTLSTKTISKRRCPCGGGGVCGRKCCSPC